MNRRTKIGASLAAGATAVLTATAIAVANPSTSSPADDATPNPTSSATTGNGHAPETPLTGSDAERATAAAMAAVPGGTVIRVETDSDGEASYEAHVRTSDGTEVIVLMDDSFNVTSTKEFAGGRGGHGRGDGDRSGDGRHSRDGDRSGDGRHSRDGDRPGDGEHSRDGDRSGDGRHSRDGDRSGDGRSGGTGTTAPSSTTSA
jgi:hypothetical protein